MLRPQPRGGGALKQLDERAADYLTEHSERLVGKQLPKEQASFVYALVLKSPEGKLPFVKFKINMHGSQRPIRCWPEDGEPADFIQEWAGKSQMFNSSHLGTLKRLNV